MDQEREKDRNKEQGNRPSPQPGENLPDGAEHQTAEREMRQPNQRPAREPGREQEEIHNSAV